MEKRLQVIKQIGFAGEILRWKMDPATERHRNSRRQTAENRRKTSRTEEAQAPGQHRYIMNASFNML